MEIREDDLRGDAIAALLREHLEDMRRITPPESVHALDIEALRAPEICFWSAWEGVQLVGCGALKELDPQSGEIKSMRTARAHRRRGVASTILEFLIAQAERRAYETLYLETGAMFEFEAARTLYESYGFRRRGPFGEYRADPNSVYMEKRLVGAGASPLRAAT